MNINDISLRTKMLTLVMVPLLACIFLAGGKIFQLQTEVRQQSDLVELMNVSVAASDLVHELQKERGASAGYLGSKGQKFADTLPQQRKLTDTKVRILKTVLAVTHVERFGKKYNEKLQTALHDLDELEDMRRKVSALTIPAGDAVKYYTTMNGDFLGITERALFITENPALVRDISAYMSFLQSKERAGIERAVGATGFSSGWNNALITKFFSLINVQETYMAVFHKFATEEEEAFFQKKASDPVFAKVQELRDIAFEMADSNGPVKPVDPGFWFDTITKKINILKQIEDHIGEDVMHLAEASANEATLFRNIYAAVLSVVILIIGFMTYVIITDLLRNIRSTQSVMKELASGNADVAVNGTERKDEIGNMARSIASFKESLVEKQYLEQEAIKAQARAEQEKIEAMEQLAQDFDSQVGGLINGLASASTELQSTAQSMRNIADETSQSSSTVASSSEEASTNVNSVAAAMEEMTASSAEITTQISNTRTRSSDTAENASKANETVANLNERVANIGEVVNAIRDIAEQTNLLALNATIEAARAGEAGKGFAVVADEVKKLASETASKTEEIESRITEIQSATTSSVEAMQRILGNVSEIDEAIAAVSAAAEEQNATNNEINRSVTEASQGVQNVTQIIVDVQRGAGETGSSADAVLTAATELAELSETLKGSVHAFLDKIRSGKTDQDNAPQTPETKTEENTEDEAYEQLQAAE